MTTKYIGLDGTAPGQLISRNLSPKSFTKLAIA